MYTVAPQPVFLILPSRWLVRDVGAALNQHLERFGFL
jgi:hypothetical protein